MKRVILDLYYRYRSAEMELDNELKRVLGSFNHLQWIAIITLMPVGAAIIAVLLITFVL